MSMSNFKRIALLATFGVALLAGACETVVIEDDTRPIPAPRPGRACPELYAPVCGSVAGRQSTFGNLCEAEDADARVLYRGECRRAEPRPEPEDVCPQIYGPVCGIRRGQFRQFDNSCVAVKSGYRVVAEGEGSCNRFAGDVEEPRACTREYRPVCAQRPDGAERTYGNACEADNDGARIRYAGECGRGISPLD